MKNLSLKNILWIVFGVVCGYSSGVMIGTLLGTMTWTLIGILSGGFFDRSTTTIIIQAALSITFGILLSLLTGSMDRRFFGSRMPLAIWIGIGASISIAVMLGYGVNFITHPEHHAKYQFVFPGIGGMPKEVFEEPAVSHKYMLLTAYGVGTGQLIGSFLGVFAGLLISIRETIFRKQKSEDKKQFDEYSKFINERLKK
jgi:hypothetical protein